MVRFPCCLQRAILSGPFRACKYYKEKISTKYSSRVFPKKVLVLGLSHCRETAVYMF